MSVSDKIKMKVSIAHILFLISLVLSPASYAAEKLSLGKPASAQEIKGWDIDIRPDGKGLPVGSGNAIDGEEMFITKCGSCHGEFAEGAGGYPVLAGGLGSLDSDHPVKTVGSYWPYASTAFDYIRRAMPFGHAQSLGDNEVYAMTAYILYSSDIIEDDFVLDQSSLPLVKMPNRDGFIKDDRPDTPSGQPCMTNCLSKKPVVIATAKQIDVTPDKEVVSSSDVSAPNVDRGKTVFGQCAACHTVNNNGENKFGPNLYAVFDRKVGSVESFTTYSSAMSSMNSSNIVWSKENLQKFLKSPQAFLPGTSMPFGGITDNDDLNDLLEFLKVGDGSTN